MDSDFRSKKHDTQSQHFLEPQSLIEAASILAVVSER